MSDHARNATELLQANCGSCAVPVPAGVTHASLVCASHVMLEHVDGAILIVRARSSLREEVERTANIVKQAGVPIFGTVMNRFKPELPFLK